MEIPAKVVIAAFEQHLKDLVLGDNDELRFGRRDGEAALVLNGRVLSYVSAGTLTALTIPLRGQ